MANKSEWQKYYSKSQKINCWSSKTKGTFPSASRHQPALFEVGWVLLPDKNPVTGASQFSNVFTGDTCSDLSKLPEYVHDSKSTSAPSTAAAPKSSPPQIPHPPAAAAPAAAAAPPVSSTTSLGKRPRPTNEEDRHKTEEHYNRLQRNREDRKNGSAAQMRARHNWIKNVLIGRTIAQVQSNTVSVLELACGKGGDFFKIKRACSDNTTLNYVGVDIAKVSLEDFVGRLAEPRSLSRQGATSINVRLSCINLGTDDMTGHGAVGNSTWSKDKGWHMGPAFRSDDQFDVVTMQFALHYMFQSRERLNKFFSTWSRHLKDGGRFIATTMDSDVVLEHLFQHVDQNPVSINDEHQRPCCSMLFDNDVRDLLTHDHGWSRPYGLRYEITLTEYNDVERSGGGGSGGGGGEPYNYVEAPEWLVIMSTLVDAAWRNGGMFVDISESMNFHEYFQKYSTRTTNNPKYNEMLTRMNVLSQEKNTFQKIEWDLTRLYRTLSFTKGGGGRRVAIIVPFRDEHSEQSRSNHLAQFMSYMLSYMCQSLVPFHIYIVEQSHGDGRK